MYRGGGGTKKEKKKKDEIFNDTDVERVRGIMGNRRSKKVGGKKGKETRLTIPSKYSQQVRRRR